MEKGKIQLLILSFLLLSLTTPAQIKKADQIKPQDSAYIENYNHLLLLSADIAQRGTSISTTHAGRPDLNLSYRPNVPALLSVGLDYRWISLSGGIARFDNERAFKGTSRPFWLRVGFIGKRFYSNNFIQSYQGMYIENPLNLDPNWNINKAPFPQRPDVGIGILYTSAYYIFNYQKFSYRAVNWPTERQKKSAGSFVAGCALLFLSAGSNANIPITHPLTPIDDSKMNLFVSRGAISLVSSFGYLYTFVVQGKWFVNLGIAPGVVSQTGIDYLSDKESIPYARQMLLCNETRLGLGYNSNKRFGGLQFQSIVFTSNKPTNWMSNASMEWVRFYYGHRLQVSERWRANKWVKKFRLD